MSFGETEKLNSLGTVRPNLEGEKERVEEDDASGAKDDELWANMLDVLRATRVGSIAFPVFCKEDRVLDVLEDGIAIDRLALNTGLSGAVVMAASSVNLDRPEEKVGEGVRALLKAGLFAGLSLSPASMDLFGFRDLARGGGERRPVIVGLCCTGCVDFAVPGDNGGVVDRCCVVLVVTPELDFQEVPQISSLLLLLGRSCLLTVLLLDLLLSPLACVVDRFKAPNGLFTEPGSCELPAFVRPEATLPERDICRPPCFDRLLCCCCCELAASLWLASCSRDEKAIVVVEPKAGGTLGVAIGRCTEYYTCICRLESQKSQVKNVGVDETYKPR